MMNLTTEEQQMLDGIRLGLAPYPTPGNFRTLWTLVEKGALQIAHESEHPRPTIVCLCGSTRFSQAFHDANLRETLDGKIVLSIGCDTKSDTDLLLAGEMTPEKKASLDELHLRKIDLASEVLILNCNGYIGDSTRRELEYARAHGKTIRWLEEEWLSRAGEDTCSICHTPCSVLIPDDLPEEMLARYGNYTVTATCAEGQRLEKEHLGICYADIQAWQAQQQERTHTR